MKKLLILCLPILLTSLVPEPAHAVMPPDFIFNIGAQLVQFFSICIALFSVIFGTALQFFRSRFSFIKHKGLAITLVIIVMVAISLGLSYLYATYQQHLEYDKWLKESQQNSVPVVSTQDDNNQLNIGSDNIVVDTSSNAFVSQVAAAEDSSVQFIVNYYRAIADKDYQKAYDLSKQSVDYDTYKNWYQQTTKITLDKLVRIDATKSSLELTLFESNSFTRYGVLMTLQFQGDVPVRVEKSDVKILDQGEVIDDVNVVSNTDSLAQEYLFFDQFKDTNIILTNQDFSNATTGLEDNYVVLDAREDIEFDNGHFPNSLHIRFADLKAGRWIELPEDKFVYVICWSGIRGKEVADFLRTKKVVASYLENGAKGWVDFGGQWNGTIQFSEKYTAEQYQRVFTTNEVQDKVAEGTLLVDTREPDKFQNEHITGSVNIPLMYTATLDMATALSQVPSGSTIITVCDGYVNCFDAKLTGIELERRGSHFLGRYNKPWEYE